MANIPNSKPSGTYNVVNSLTTFTFEPLTPCAGQISQTNLAKMDYFATETGRCGDAAAKITKPFLNSVLSQIYTVVDQSGITLNTDWMCSQPNALLLAIQALNTDAAGLGGVYDG